MLVCQQSETAVCGLLFFARRIVDLMPVMAVAR